MTLLESQTQGARRLFAPEFEDRTLPQGLCVRRLLEENSKLKAQVEVLAEENKTLRAQPSMEFRLTAAFHLTKAHARFLACLMSRDLVSRDVMYTWMYGLDFNPHDIKVLDVHLSHLRKVLPNAVVIDTIRGQGWRLSPEGRAVVLARLREVQP